MGKYMKKGKMNGVGGGGGGEVVMEVGVCTRARSLALLQQPESELSYLQLRSRRLHKPQFHSHPPPPTPPPPRQRVKDGEKGIGSRMGRAGSGKTGSGSFGGCLEKEEGCFGNFGGGEGFGEAASCGENNFEYDYDAGAAERSTRESTPCSFIRDLDPAGTPGSAVRPSVSRRARNGVQRIIPTTLEMEEFFADAELQQQKLFMEKYNFDVASDSPLPGRYEWLAVDP